VGGWNGVGLAGGAVASGEAVAAVVLVGLAMPVAVLEGGASGPRVGVSTRGASVAAVAIGPETMAVSARGEVAGALASGLAAVATWLSAVRKSEVVLSINPIAITTSITASTVFQEICICMSTRPG